MLLWTLITSNFLIQQNKYHKHISHIILLNEAQLSLTLGLRSNIHNTSIFWLLSFHLKHINVCKSWFCILWVFLRNATNISYTTILFFHLESKSYFYIFFRCQFFVKSYLLYNNNTIFKQVEKKLEYVTIIFE